MDPPSDPSLKYHRRSLDVAFKDLVAFTPPPPLASDAGDAFVKRANAPRIQIMSVASRLKALNLSERGLIGQFTGI